MKVLIRNLQRPTRIHTRKIRSDSLRLLGSFGLEKAELGILLVNNARMKRLNSLHRGIAKSTDVLSFPLYWSIEEMPTGRDFLLGDIVINVEAAKKQAAGFGLSLDQEVRRLLIHAFLHLLGHDHETGRNEERRMRRREKELRNALEEMD